MGKHYNNKQNNLQRLQNSTKETRHNAGHKNNKLHSKTKFQNILHNPSWKVFALMK